MIDAIPGWLNVASTDRARIIESGARQESMQNLWRAALGTPDHQRSQASLMPAGFGSNATASSGLLSGGLQQALLLLAEAGTGEPPALGSPAAGPASSAPAPSVGAAAKGELRGLGANSHFAPLLEAAAKRTGLPPAALASIIDAEAGRTADGSWNLKARNPRSSAAGLGQFLNGTWEDVAETPGTWLNQAARARGWLTDSGAVRSGAREDLLSLRFDAEASIESIADFARQNLDGLARSGVVVGSSQREVAHAAYLTHHLGLGDAKRFLGEGLPAGRARYLLAAQVGESRANRGISEAGDAASAHRDWLLSFVDKKIDPSRYA